MGKAMNEKLFVSDLIKQFQRRRYDLGLTQPEVDQLIGVAPGLVAKWEIGNRKPTMFNAFCWAEALDCDIKLETKDDCMRD
jgi:transcriptional regulator with XRE-family HTH domain